MPEGPRRETLAALDDADRRLVRATQAGLPLVPRPWDLLGAELGMTGEEVRRRMRDLLDRGVVRRIGCVPNHYALGYRFNGMTVWDVDDERIDALGAAVGALPFVTHCYRRPRRPPEWPYNLFAMVHCKSAAEAEGLVATIAGVLGDACRGRDVLFSTRILKKTGLRLGV
ncbi:MAG TPA: Lrp/AsnC family transcriptional regulator [Rhodocyclaceae bacterium]|nr:Lrp/AsnC family transcriptional regulator [Rhodocyclaceae bacterium]